MFITFKVNEHFRETYIILFLDKRQQLTTVVTKGSYIDFIY